jgi:glycosyltransferase involved in cell wall biosynthesis
MRKNIRVLHLRDTNFLCGPGKTILETVRMNTDSDVVYEVAAFGNIDVNPYLKVVREYCYAFGLPETRTRLVQTGAMLARHVREHDISIIHPHDFKTRLLTAVARRFAKVPIITTAHGFIDISLKSKLYNLFDKKLLQSADIVFAVSAAMVRHLTDIGVPKARIRLARNCIVLSKYPYGMRSSTTRQTLGLSDDHVVIGHIGRLSPEKGQRELIRVFPAVLARIPKARLLFAGDGPDNDALRKQVGEMGVEHAVSFLGHRTDILEVFGSLDLLVLSSKTEGMSNVLLEAMALGVPVVASAVGGTPELVKDGVTGLLVPAGDDQTLAEAIVSSLTSTAATTTRAIEARKLIEREFDMSDLIRSTHEVYRQQLRDSAC